MPLPPALAARLAKRGILPKEEKKEQEEVFAESYDDEGQAPAQLRKRPPVINANQDNIKIYGYPGCPNKCNPYHKCQTYCFNHWGAGKPSPLPEYEKLHEKMMECYGPLPEGWEQHYDPGTGRHFYWCTRTNQVSWMPPGHPKAKVVDAASQVREIILMQENEPKPKEGEEQSMDLDSDNESEDEEDHEIEERRRREKESRQLELDKYKNKGRPPPPGMLNDPMDPSSYSDAPRGTWSSGLEKSRSDN